MTSVFFIRHGQSESNAGLRTDHPASIRLTALGHQQAQIVATIFGSAPDLIVHSPYLRTRETAAPLLARYPAVPVEEWAVQEFTYLHPEHWRGTTGAERTPAAHAYWERSDPFYRDGPGAESFADLLERVQVARVRIQNLAARCIVVFSHGQFTRAFWWPLLTPHIVGPTAEAMRRFRAFTQGVSLPNCAMLTFHFDGGSELSSGVQLRHLPGDLITR